MSKYLKAITDLPFKKVFGKHEKPVISLLNTFLPLNGRVIESVSFVSFEQFPENPVKEYSLVNVECVDNSGQTFIVELLTYWNIKYVVRDFVYSFNLYDRQQETDRKDVYFFCILDDNVFPVCKNDSDYVHEYSLVSKKQQDIVQKNMSLILVDLSKYKPVDKSQRKLKDLWMKYFTEINENTVEADEDLLNNPDTAEALEIVKRSAYSNAELASYERSRFDEKTERSALLVSREEGFVEGKAKGERQKAVEMAKAMKKKGLSGAMIAEISGLSKEEIDVL